jgi:transposase
MRQVPDAQSRELMALVARHRQLVAMLTAESNRHGNVPGCVSRAIAVHIRWLRKQLADFDAILEDVIRRSSLWCEKAALLRSVPDVGVSLLLPSSTTCPSSALSVGAKLPLWWESRFSNRDSGKMRGTRAIWAGARPGARYTLYVQLLWQRAATQYCGRSIFVCAPRARSRRSRLPRACASCSLY